MEKMLLPSILVMLFVILVMFAEGCVQQIGGQTDEHGCLIPAGYSWCEDKQKCLRTWEENCTNIVGGDRDEHGCIGSAGYSWCEDKQKCLRIWEENCTTISDHELTAEEYARMQEEICNGAGGNWNNCSNKCAIDNQGIEGAACTLQCEQLCECGGIAGFGCPDGYTCKMPSDIADALGYCVMQ